MTIAEPLVAGAPEVGAESSALTGVADQRGTAPAETFRADVAGGVRWSLLATISTQVGRLAFSVVLMRLLGPENFGIAGQAAVYLMITAILVNFGMSATVIQRPQLDRSEIGSAFWTNVAVGVVLAVLTFALAPVLAAFFRTEELTAVVRVLSTAFLLKAVAVVPAALLNRAMRFRSIGVAEISSTFISGALAVVAAANGAGYWALVVQILAFDVIYAALILRMAGWPPLVWTAAAAKRLWPFSSRVMGADFVNYISNNGDKFLIARVLGATPLALYSLAYRVLILPGESLAGGMRVIFPMFSRLQDDRDRMARFFLDASEAASLVITPVMVLTILSAPMAVPAVFGEAWEPAVLALQLLAVTGIHWLLLGLTGHVVLAAGRADWELRWSIVTTIAALTGFAIGLQWGIAGVAASYLAVGAVLNPVRYLMIRRLIPITALGYLRVLAPAATSSAALAVAWLVAAAALPGTVGDLGVIAVASVLGLVLYVAALRFVWPGDFRRQLDFARLVVRPRSA